MTPEHFRRPISPTERLYLAATSPTSPLVIHLAVEGYGDLPLATLQRAVAEAAQACPGSRLIHQAKFWTDSGRAPTVHLLEPGTLDAQRFTDPPGFLRHTLPPEGPTCEVLLHPADGTRPGTVVFRAHHAVMDGRGVLRWAGEVFRALRGETPHPARSTMTDHTLLKELNQPAHHTHPIRTTLAAKAPWPTATSQSHGFLWRKRTIAGTHPALVAKLASAVTETCGLPQQRAMVPVDLRRHAPELSSTANLTLPIFLDTRPGTRWEELQRQLLDALAANAELASGPQQLASRVPLSALRHVLRTVTAASERRDRYLCTALISHLGRTDLESFSSGEFTASTVYSLPVQSPLVPLSLVAVECLGRTEITLCHPNGPQAADHAEELLDAIEETLSPRQARLWEGNRTARPTAAQESAESLVDLFRRQAAHTPDAVALADPQGELTYAELDRRSDTIACELQDLGAGRGSVVGLLMDHSADAITALWAVLKSGAAYLPLDPAYPDTRIRQILHDAGATVCLTHKRHADRIVPYGTLLLDELPQQPGRVPAADASPRPDDVAYVLYTSGSTGRPKGVEVEHRNLLNYVAWATRRYQVDRTSRFALFTSLAFDLTGTSIFLPLLTGGSVALVPGPLDHLTLRYALEECKATALKLTPTHLDLIARLGLHPSGFRTLIVGGEQLTGPLAAGTQRLFGPGCAVINEYGPTEATIGCVVHQFDPHRDAESPVVPIGLPVDNTKVHLLDADRGFVPAGETGEIYLVGDQLARGYRLQPRLSSERFVRLADGTRAYRTGDLARLLPSGVLEYIGRVDDQIKIHGHRIEPAEVAYPLELHPAVARAFVVARRPPGQTHHALCAYVTTRADVTAAALTRHLAEHLPRYLVPTAIIKMSEFPCTMNGKIDAAALPDPFSQHGDAEGKQPLYEAQDEIERQIARIWSEVLPLDAARIDETADFYLMGGDSLSLLAMFAGVTHLVGEQHQHGLMAELRSIAHQPRFDRVCAVVRGATSKGEDN
ncbi:amino acid adenylation domain-containing protein [Streptomyces inhibens]|uniref:Amino acid adenylation domain-containing protein n=1 Tax=Streptomyces inhibens TaxID=2293571 RepID=A0A371QBG3_STRIH|nr:non-ribosomal peptide synthetase [Streptomyces inhibens]REK91803.1 amino acid adenylation domain-containing protein [Streptomyces inhibens]